MAFNYNGTSPTAIKYNGTDLTVLKYGTTAVWGKPYSLTISAGSNTSVTVTRTSSPNQHASTGTLSSGSVIYYGDVLTISYSVSSGYKISTATVNGTSFTSGQSFTVTSAISVVTTAVASASWHTIWTGSYNAPLTNWVNWQNFRFNLPTTINTSRPTRITLTSYDYFGDINISWGLQVSNTTIQMPGTFGDVEVTTLYSTYLQCKYTSNLYDEYSTDSITYHKIEQYY